MSDGHTDSRREQTQLSGIWAGQSPRDPEPTLILDELFWMRKELEDMRKDIFDTNELIGRLATQIQVWVGVAEED